MSKSMKAIDPDERARIAQLHNEAQTVDKNKVEWLYGGEKIDKEAYLLGKPIDKLLVESEKKEAETARAKFAATVDLANKIREDPLFEIKKMEIESKKRILENPLKMKHLRELISQRSHEEEESRGGSSKRHKHRRRSSSSESSDDDNRKRKHASKDDRYGYHGTSKPSSGSSDHSKNQEVRREAEMHKKRIEDLKRIREASSRDERDRDAAKKLSAEEKQRKLQQMSENAKWRNDVRDKNVKKYKHDDKKEDEDRGSKYGPGDMFSSMMRDAYSSTEERIKRNVKNIQRSESSYDSNFARR